MGVLYILTILDYDTGINWQQCVKLSMCIVGQEMATWIDTFSKAKKHKKTFLFFIDLSTIHYFII